MNKYCMLFVIFLFLSFGSIAQSAPVYIEGINDFETVDPDWTCDPMKEVTFLYTPSLSYNLEEVDFFTNSGIGNLIVRVREDLGGVPGNILGETTFQLSGGSGFQGSQFTSSVSLVTGNDYWVGWYSQLTTGSHFASQGNIITEYAAMNIDGIWNIGPIAWTRPMIKFYSTDTAPVPIPAAVWLLGSGFIGLIGIRRRLDK